jgi:hypothetical protein
MCSCGHCLHSIDHPGQEGRAYLPSRGAGAEADPQAMRGAAKAASSGRREWLELLYGQSVDDEDDFDQYRPISFVIDSRDPQYPISHAQRRLDR